MTFSFIFALMLSFGGMGCYSYRYHAFDPPKIPIDGGQLTFISQQNFYDSLSNSLKHFTGSEKRTDIYWYIFFMYKARPPATVYLLQADTIFVFLPDRTDSISVPILYNGFADAMRGDAFGSFGPIILDETKYSEIEIKSTLSLLDFDSKKLIKTIPIHLNAKLKKGHGSEFMK